MGPKKALRALRALGALWCTKGAKGARSAKGAEHPNAPPAPLAPLAPLALYTRPLLPPRQQFRAEALRLGDPLHFDRDSIDRLLEVLDALIQLRWRRQSPRPRHRFKGKHSDGRERA